MMKINHSNPVIHWLHLAILFMCMFQVAACANATDVETEQSAETPSNGPRAEEPLTENTESIQGQSGRNDSFADTDIEDETEPADFNDDNQITESDLEEQEGFEQEISNEQEGSSASSTSIEVGRFFEHGSTMDFRGTLTGQGGVEILNLQGDIEFRLSPGNELSIRAEKSAQYSDLDDAHFEVIVSEGWITACAMYPNVQGMPANRCESDGTSQLNAGDTDVTVRWIVSLPATHLAIAKNVTGNISAFDMVQPVDAVTVTGSITLDTQDIAFAETVTGNVSVSMNPAASNEYGFDTLSFSAVNGTVDVNIPTSARVDFLGTSVAGRVNTEFSLPNDGAQRVEGAINGGGPLVRLTSVSGSVSLGQR